MIKTDEEVEQIANKFVSELKNFTYSQIQTISFKIMSKSAEIAIVS